MPNNFSHRRKATSLARLQLMTLVISGLILTALSGAASAQVVIQPNKIPTVSEYRVGNIRLIYATPVRRVIKIPTMVDISRPAQNQPRKAVTSTRERPLLQEAFRAEGMDSEGGGSLAGMGGLTPSGSCTQCALSSSHAAPLPLLPVTRSPALTQRR